MHFSVFDQSLPKCNFIEFKDSSVDDIVLNLAASVYYHDFRPYYFCSCFLSCPLKFPITHFLKQLISIPEWIQTSFIKVSPTLDQISVFAWNLVPCYQHCLKRLYSQLFWKFWQKVRVGRILRRLIVNKKRSMKTWKVKDVNDF